MKPLLPAFLDLAERKVVLVGGGRVARGKLPGLLETGAAVTVVAPAILPELRSAGVTVVGRAFEPADLDGAWLAVAAATREVNGAVARAAAARRIFVNAVDDVDTASAFGCGVLRRGGVTVAISTAGAAPALAGLLREGLEAVLPEDLGAWVAAGQALRADWKRAGIPVPGRRPLLLRALNQLYAGKL